MDYNHALDNACCVLTFTAFAVGALGLKRSSFAQPNKNNIAIVESPQNCTNLMEEISALRSLVETQRNVSQLDNRYSSSGYSLSISACRLVNSINSVQQNISQLDDQFLPLGHSLSMSAS